MKNSTHRGIFLCPITSVEEAANNIFVLQFRSPELARATLPGQFVNIKVSSGYEPLLRRPFSVYRTEGEQVEIIFNTRGHGTKILSKKKVGEQLDVLGPLGTPYGCDDAFNTALLVAGGLGVAPLPMITDVLLTAKKTILTFLGARTRDQIVSNHLENLFLATDDGSEGFQGTVVDLLENELHSRQFPRPKIFACGPNSMLKNLALLADSYGIPCEVSLECAMACGFGICQGCPVERAQNSQNVVQNKFHLVCKGGPVFNIHQIVIE